MLSIGKGQMHQDRDIQTFLYKIANNRTCLKNLASRDSRDNMDLGSAWSLKNKGIWF